MECHTNAKTQDLFLCVSSYVEHHRRYHYIPLNIRKIHCSSEIKYKCHVIWIKKTWEKKRTFNYIPAQR